MASESKEGSSNPVQFIHFAAPSSDDHVRNRHLAKAHVARLNSAERRRRRIERGASRAAALETTRALVPIRIKEESSQSTSEDDHAQPTGQEANAVEEYTKDVNAGNSIRHTLSPVTGAFLPGTFDSHDTATVLEMQRYWYEVLAPNNAIPSSALPSFWEGFTSYSLFFHGICYISTLSKRLTNGYLSRAEQLQLLTHRNLAIRCLHDEISRLNVFNAEMVVSGILTLYPEEPDDSVDASKVRCLFRPHMPEAESVNLAIYGPKDIAAHRRALRFLVQYVGGIGNLRIAGLARTLATTDLVAASSTCTRPDFPWLWRVDPRSELRSGLFLPHPGPAGKGFFDRVPGGLPSEALAVFADLAAVDFTMSQYRDRYPPEEDFQILMNARDGTHHRLLSLLSWDQLDESERAGSFSATYECCRLTALVYSHCVIVPVLFQSDGVQKPLRELRSILETIDMSSWSQDFAALLIWCLLVGGVAAYGTEHEVVFNQRLKEVLMVSQVRSLEATQRIAERFIWSRSACDQGARALWNDM